MPDESPAGTTVVTGRREVGADGSPVWVFTRSASGTSGIRRVEPREVSENPDAAPLLEISITIEKSDSNTNDADLQAAAEALIKAIAAVIDKIEAADPSLVVSILGVGVSIGYLMNVLMNTDFVITDRQNFGNNGVGGDDMNTSGGRHRDTINYRAINGPPLTPGGGIYNDPNYSNGEGMLALVLHELLHLTPQGRDFFDRSLARWISNGGTNATFYDSEYARNLERFINNLAMQALAALEVATRGDAPPLSPLGPPLQPESF